MKEIWKPLPKCPSDYEISSLCRVRSIEKTVSRASTSQGGENYTRRQKILKPAKTKDGYLRNSISIKGKIQSFLPHREGCIAFLPNPENKAEVNHKNGIKTDNRISNLEWMTREENVQHSFDTGLQIPKKGELNGMSTTTEEDVLSIRAYVSNFRKTGKRYYGRKQLAMRFGITESCLKDIVTRRTWTHI